MTSDNAFLTQWLQISGQATQEMAEKRKAVVAAAMRGGEGYGWTLQCMRQETCR